MQVAPIEDKPINGQKYCVVSMVSPDNEHNKCPVRAFKIKYVAETVEECKQMAKQWRDSGEEPMDQFLSRVGVWVPFVDDIYQTENIDYHQAELTEFIMGARARDKEAKKYFDDRVGKCVEDAKNPQTRDAVMLRHEINQLETQVEGLQKRVVELVEQLREFPAEAQEESRQSFISLVSPEVQEDLLSSDVRLNAE